MECRRPVGPRFVFNSSNTSTRVGGTSEIGRSSQIQSERRLGKEPVSPNLRAVLNLRRKSPTDTAKPTFGIRSSLNPKALLSNTERDLHTTVVRTVKRPEGRGPEAVSRRTPGRGRKPFSPSRVESRCRTSGRAGGWQAGLVYRLPSPHRACRKGLRQGKGFRHPHHRQTQ
jgi:hypothetical protein